MRDTLPGKVSLWAVECGFVNLDESKNNGTYWVCYYKNNEKRYYFDSFELDPSFNSYKKQFEIINSNTSSGDQDPSKNRS